LPLAALREDRRQRPLLGDAEEAVRREQHHERVEDRTPAHARHVLDAERDRAGRLAMRRVHEPDDVAIREQADRHGAIPEEAIEFRCRRVVARRSDSLWLVEIEPDAARHGAEIPDEHLVARTRFARGRRVGAFERSRFELAERHRRAERLLALRHVERELLGERLAGVERVRREAEKLRKEPADVGDAVALGARLAHA
jgi:hypothetical protein